MPSPITKALSKLHLRRGSASGTGANSPPASPGRRSEDVGRSPTTSGFGASRQSLDQSRPGRDQYQHGGDDGSPPPLPVKQNLFTSQTGDYAPGQASKQVGDVPLAAHNAISPATLDPASVRGGSGSGQGGFAPVAATTRATGDEVTVPASAITQNRRSSLSNASTPIAQPLPRSPAKYALPTIPATPATEAPPQLPPLSVGGDNSDLERSVFGTVGSETRGVETGTGGGIMDGPPRGMGDGWVERGAPIKQSYDLTPPEDLFPVVALPPPVGGPTGTVPSRSLTTGPIAPANPHRDAAYSSTHVISHTKRETTEEEHRAHVAKHLALLPSTIFGGTPLGTSSNSGSRSSASGSASPTRRAFGPPGKITPLRAGPAVPSSERDRILTAQRHSLVTGIADSESAARGSGVRAGAGPRAVEGRTKEVFDRIGWADRLGVMDTVDVGTRVLEPVIQEHVRPVETVTYLLAIEREIHQYHIYPYIQPIRDPNPTVLPTRHLFKDNDGNYREIIGDAAAEVVLGGPIDRSEGKIYYERWIEGVDGIEYQVEEDKSVLVGRKAWVDKVGDRGREVLPSRGGEEPLRPMPYVGLPAEATTIGKSLDDIFGTGNSASTSTGARAAGASTESAKRLNAGSKHTGYHVPRTQIESPRSTGRTGTDFSGTVDRPESDDPRIGRAI